MLREANPGRYFSIVWGVSECVFSLANNPVVGILCCLSPPGPAVLPGAAKYRPASGVSGFWIRQVQRQMSVGTLVGSRERRALFVTRMNRWQTAGQPLFFVPPPVYIGFPLFVLAKINSDKLFTVPWRARGTGRRKGLWLPGRRKCQHSVLPSFALPRRSP